MVTSVVLSVVLTLNIALIVAGIAAEGGGDAQQAYVAVGGVALGFSLLTGLASFILVVGICVRLQRRDVALWQIVGLLPRTALLIMLIEILVVSAVSAAIGSVASTLAWPVYADFVGTSGLPHSSVLDDSIPSSALIIGIISTATASLLAGIHSARKVVRGNLVEGVQSSTTFEAKSPTMIMRIVTIIIGIALLIGVIAIYGAIGQGDKITDSRALGDFLTTYPGMGLLLCLIFAVVGSPIIKLLVNAIKIIPDGSMPKFLASREAAARPRLTQALIMPITLSAAAVGVMMAWVDKLSDVLIAESGSSDSVSAPPEQMALLLGGPVIVACMSAAAIVFATAVNRQEDNALLLVSGSTSKTVYAKAVAEALIYAAVSLVCAYLIVIVNEVGMVAALSSGPIPSVNFALPGWSGAGVVLFGIALTLIMLLIIISAGLKKQPISIVLRGK